MGLAMPDGKMEQGELTGSDGTANHALEAVAAPTFVAGVDGGMQVFDGAGPLAVCRAMDRPRPALAPGRSTLPSHRPPALGWPPAGTQTGSNVCWCRFPWAVDAIACNGNGIRRLSGVAVGLDTLLVVGLSVHWRSVVGGRTLEEWWVGGCGGVAAGSSWVQCPVTLSVRRHDIPPTKVGGHGHGLGAAEGGRALQRMEVSLLFITECLPPALGLLFRFRAPCSPGPSGLYLELGAVWRRAGLPARGCVALLPRCNCARRAGCCCMPGARQAATGTYSQRYAATGRPPAGLSFSSSTPLWEIAVNL